VAQWCGAAGGYYSPSMAPHIGGAAIVVTNDRQKTPPIVAQHGLTTRGCVVIRAV
jgi:hypothetical protein